jgi:hypothetical protein
LIGLSQPTGGLGPHLKKGQKMHNPLSTIIVIEDGMRITTGEWEDDSVSSVWFELDFNNGHIVITMTPDETRLLIEGFQKVLDSFEKKNGRVT